MFNGIDSNAEQEQCLTLHNREIYAFFFIFYHILGFYISCSFYLSVVAYVMSGAQLAIPGFEALNELQDNWVTCALISR